jgi:hypothetical protein
MLPVPGIAALERRCSLPGTGRCGAVPGPESVLLTKNEVASARKDPEHAVLAVVHGIDLDFAADPPTASDGKFLWLNPWHIRDEALTPIAYRYVLPSDEISKATSTVYSLAA